MKYQVACSCGNVLPISEGQAGSSIPCICGRMVCVPSLRVLCSEAITENAPPAIPIVAPPQPLLGLDRVAEIISPTQVWLQTTGGLAHTSPKRVMLALTAEFLWLQDV